MIGDRAPERVGVRAGESALDPAKNRPQTLSTASARAILKPARSLSAASPSSSKNLRNETLSDPALKIGAGRPGRKRPRKRPRGTVLFKQLLDARLFRRRESFRNHAVPSNLVPNFRPAKKIMLSPANTPAYMNALTLIHRVAVDDAQHTGR